MNTLPDYLRRDLAMVSIGLNPSVPSVEAGYYFANPRNRFWKALNRSRLVDRALEPGVDAMQTLFDRYNIGFTDLVKKPTRSASQLRAADYREGAPLLQDKLLEYQPRLAWFHGKVAYRNYLKYAEGREADIPWGVQKRRIGRAAVFVTPNPSPANAGFSLDDLVRHYNDMVGFLIREGLGLG